MVYIFRQCSLCRRYYNNYIQLTGHVPEVVLIASYSKQFGMTGGGAGLRCHYVCHMKRVIIYVI